LSEPVKLLFDECLGKPLVDDIKKLLSWDTPSPKIEHLLDYFAEGTCDSIWVPKVAHEGWMIVSGDRGRKSRIKLPAICSAYQITHILMGPSILHLKQHEKANIIVGVWDQIKECSAAPKGTAFILRMVGHRPTIKPKT